MSELKKGRIPRFNEALLLFIVAVGSISLSIILLGIDVQVALCFALFVAVIFAIYLGYSVNAIEKMIIKGVESSSMMLVFNLLIGMVVASWIAAGIIPYIIYLGLAWFTPALVPFLACALCSLMSMMIGSSWTTGGTVGLAFVTIATAMGYPLPLICGAVITGAMFGDKQSPLSETTVFAASVSEVRLMDHVSSMRYTSVTSLAISLIIYAFLGFRYVTTGEVDLTEIEIIRALLAETFKLNPLLLLMPILLIWMLIKRINALFCLGAAIVAGFVTGIFFQGLSIYDMASVLMSGLHVKTGSEIVDMICSKGGLNSMWYIVSVTILGFAMSEVLTETHVYETLVNSFADKLRSPKSIITSSLLTGMLLSFGTAASYVPALITAGCYKDIYNKAGIDRRVLSRTLEDGTTITNPMAPWLPSGMFFATLFGCEVWAYLPYYLLGFFNPLMAIICAFTGYGVFYTNHKKGWGKNKYQPEKDGTIALAVTEEYYKTLV